jgi:methionyl-tRNA formyltransferase
MPELSIVGVVSSPDRRAGRGRRLASSPVVERARPLGIPILQPRSLRDAESIEAISALGFDLGLLADYGRLVPPSVLGIPARGFLNVHPSLLPRHRGATPIQATILEGDAEAGVSIFQMDAGLDTGPIVASMAWPLRGDETGPELEAEAARRGGRLVAEVLPEWLAGRRPAVPQPAAGSTLTRPLRREDGRLDPDLPAAILARRVRALQPWPGAWIETNAGRLAVIGAAAAPGSSGGPGARPGTVISDGDGLALTTPAGRLRLLMIRPAGGRTMTGAELRRGRPGLVGSMVG